MAMFRIEVQEGLAHLALSRPEASNALDASFWSGLAPALQALDRTGEIRALLLTGEGKNFCAGMDLSAFAAGGIATDTPAQREAFHHLARELQGVLTAVERTRFPVIAVIQGACVGAGLELAAVCDLRFLAADAYFRIEEINIGMMADVGALQRLPKLMPEAVVKEMAFLGATLGAERAQQLGFATAVAETQEAALAAAQSAAQRILARAPLAMAGSKAALRFARDHSVAEALEWAALMQGSIWNPADILAAMQARALKQPATLAPLAPLQDGAP